MPNNLNIEKTQTSGVLTFAFGAEYQTQALCQALTLRKSLGMELTAIVGERDKVNKRLEKVANIKVLAGNFSRFEYEQHALELTPYDITYKTDADILFPSGSLLYHPKGLPCTSGVATDIRGTVSQNTDYRRIERSLGCPTIYSACFSFKRDNAKSAEFFDVVRRLYRDWYRLKLWEGQELKLKPTTDSVYSIAWLNVFGTARVDGNHFVHAKPAINGWSGAKWTDERVLMTDNGGRMFMDGVRLCQPFHYYDKSLITEDFVERIEDVCRVREAGTKWTERRAKRSSAPRAPL